MRRVLAIALCGSSLVACGHTRGTDSSHAIVVSSYAVEYLVHRVAPRVATRNLARPGVEPHDIELTSDDIDAIDDARLVFYIGSGFQPAVAAAAKRRGANAIALSDGVVGRFHDPHFWLDPVMMARAAGEVARALSAADHLRTFTDDLNALDADYKRALSHCARNTFVTTHESFGYLARRYGLTELSISGVAPDAEPSPQRLADLSRTIRRDGITTVFYEPRVPRAAAETLARDAGVSTRALDPYESTTDDYFTVMRRNLAALRTALACS